MNPICDKFINFIAANPQISDKNRMIQEVQREFALIKDRSVLFCDHFAVRFCLSKSDSDSFSNTVMSLSRLRLYDMTPIFVVLIRTNPALPNSIFLANSSFISKISHSSKKLTPTNICGSFNGSDIMRKGWYKTPEGTDLDNIPENFHTLFAIHKGFSLEDNMERLIEASSKIAPKKPKYQPTDAERQTIFRSVDRARNFVASDNFAELLDDLQSRCNQNRDAILAASHIENVNIRGRLIEALITSNDDEMRTKMLSDIKNIEAHLPAYDVKNGLGDYIKEFEDHNTYTDIKTKVMYLNSNPKAYNVDKFLQTMAEDKSVFMFFFIGIDEIGTFHTILCSVYHKALIAGTILQTHWAGRNSRGVTQFNGTVIFEMINDPDFTNEIEDKASNDFLSELLAR